MIFINIISKDLVLQAIVLKKKNDCPFSNPNDKIFYTSVFKT